MARLFRRDGDVPKKSFWQKVKSVVTTNWRVAVRGGVDQGSLEQLEQVLLESDFGPSVTLKLVAAVEDRARRGQVRTEEEFAIALQDEITRAARRQFRRRTAHGGAGADSDSCSRCEWCR